MTTPILEKCKARLQDAIRSAPDENGYVSIRVDSLVMINTWFEILEMREITDRAEIEKLKKQLKDHGID